MSTTLPPQLAAPTGPPNILSLPKEILLRVAKALERTGDRKGLQSMRATCTKFKEIMHDYDGYLFSTVNLGLSQDSFDNIRELSLGPLNTHVRSIQVETEVPLKSMDEEEWEQGVASFGDRSDAETDSEMMFDDALAEYRDSLSPEQKAQHREEYLRRMISQQILYQQSVGVPNHALDPNRWAQVFARFPNLENVVFNGGIASRYVPSYTRGIGQRSIHMETLSQPPKIIEASDEELTYEWLTQRTAEQNYPSHWFCAVLNGLYRSRSTSIQEISLLYVPITMFGFLWLQASKGDLPSLETLNVSLMTDAGQDDRLAKEIRENLHRVVSVIGPNLREISWFGGEADTYDVSFYRPCVPLPMPTYPATLETVTIEYAQATMSDWMEFIKGLGLRVRELHLYDAICDDGHWVDLFHVISHFCPNLEVCEIGGDQGLQDALGGWVCNDAANPGLLQNMRNWLIRMPNAGPPLRPSWDGDHLSVDVWRPLSDDSMRFTLHNG